VLIALYAAAAMLIQDIMAVLLVQAEARNRATLSAILDCLMWPASILMTTITVTALQGHHDATKAAVIIAVELANFAGSYIAIGIGRRYIKDAEAACACGCPVAAKERLCPCMAATCGTSTKRYAAETSSP